MGWLDSSCNKCYIVGTNMVDDRVACERPLVCIPLDTHAHRTVALCEVWHHGPTRLKTAGNTVHLVPKEINAQELLDRMESSFRCTDGVCFDIYFQKAAALIDFQPWVASSQRTRVENLEKAVNGWKRTEGDMRGSKCLPLCDSAVFSVLRTRHGLQIKSSHVAATCNISHLSTRREIQ